MPIWQLCANLLIPNCLRSNLFYSPLAALELYVTYSNPIKFRIKLKRERQIELFAEGKRYYDLRRWKDAEVEEAMPVYGCYTFMSNANKDLFHTPVPISNLSATFSPKMYFWPIKHSELKRNKLLTQNPGWTYND